MPRKKRERKGDFTVKDIATMLEERNDKLSYNPEDWGIFAQITTMFEDEIVEKAIQQFPTVGDKARVGAYLMSICKSVAKSKGVLSRPTQHIPSVLNSIEDVNTTLKEGKC